MATDIQCLPFVVIDWYHLTAHQVTDFPVAFTVHAHRFLIFKLLEWQSINFQP